MASALGEHLDAFPEERASWLLDNRPGAKATTRADESPERPSFLWLRSLGLNRSTQRVSFPDNWTPCQEPDDRWGSEAVQETAGLGIAGASGGTLENLARPSWQSTETRDETPWQIDTARG